MSSLVRVWELQGLCEFWFDNRHKTETFGLTRNQNTAWSRLHWIILFVQCNLKPLNPTSNHKKKKTDSNSGRRSSGWSVLNNSQLWAHRYTHGWRPSLKPGFHMITTVCDRSASRRRTFVPGVCGTDRDLLYRSLRPCAADVGDTCFHMSATWRRQTADR